MYKTEINEKSTEEFRKIITDFINDISNTFPEYKDIISKWWKKTDFSYIKDNSERILNEEVENLENMDNIFKYCLKFYPERFFDIIYQNEDIFSNGSTVNTDFLPGLSFKILWQCNDITENTRSTIWKYLQLILLSLIGSIKNKETFGDAVKMFENVDENDFKNKLEQSLEKLHDVFNNLKNFENNTDNNKNDDSDIDMKNMGGVNLNDINMDNLPSPDDVHKHIKGMLDGKLGKLASEIAEEVSESFSLDMENITDTKDIFQSLFKDPGKLMSLVKNVGNKLESKIKSGDINESELFNEATEIINKMKSIPCMDNIQNMINQMGLKTNIPGFMNNDIKPNEDAINRSMKHKKFKENIKRKLEMKEMQKLLEQTSQISNTNYNPISDEELISIFSEKSKIKKKTK